MRGLGLGLAIGLLLAFIILGGLRARPTLGSQPILNREQIVWIDWRGRERKMLIEREVHLR